MKSFAFIVLIAAFVAAAFAVPVAEEQKTEEVHLEEKPSEEAELERFRKSASYGSAPSYAPKIAPGYAASGSYGAAPLYGAQQLSYPSPAPHVPCPKQVLVGCAPSVSTVPCQAPKYSAPSYSGAYSEPIATYAYPSYQEYY